LLYAASFFSGQKSEEEIPADTNEDVLPIAAPADGVPMYLLFPGDGGKLYPEERQLSQSKAAEQAIRQLVEALLAGPQSEALFPLFPGAVTSVDILLGKSSRVYVNLISKELSSTPPMGTHQEMLTVYSLVNSIILNFPQVRGVVLLWNGEQNLTFAGHIDTSLPLAADPSLTANPPE
jgi:hypothetical protein